jgi:quinoprotein glucose dehydrogenase
VDIRARLSREQVATLVTHGKGLMPAFPGLTKEDLARLTAFLFSDAPQASPQIPVTAAAVKPTERYRSGFGFMITSSGLSPIKPPWTSLTAYDLNQGTIKWKIPLGEVPELAAKGFKNTGSHYPKVGPVVTAGGLIFTGTRDRKVRAFDEDTGQMLWETEVSEAMEGIPAVYEVGGREYIVFCAAAQAKIPLPDSTGPAPQVKNGAYVAFALPDK